MPLFIRPTSIPSIVAAEEAISSGKSPKAAAGYRTADDHLRELRADYGRLSRWLFGILGTAGALGAGLVAGVSIDLLAEGQVVLGSVLILVASGVAAASAWLLIALHRTGRRLVHALAYWAGYPFRTGQRKPAGSRDFFVRLGPDSDLYARMLTSAIAALWSAFAVSMIRFGIAEYPTPAVTVIASAWLVTLVCVAIGQYGGVLRVQRGYRAGSAASE
ncbi:hypothetical protein ABZ477_05360 [Microbacterium sp. NPDC019599]|uniref:hypothetical protein n=1 Tax=Microbacterium sp. NPDC019599 TaxID=3154690 RepID=UPI0033C73D01